MLLENQLHVKGCLLPPVLFLLRAFPMPDGCRVPIVGREDAAGNISTAMKQKGVSRKTGETLGAARWRGLPPAAAVLQRQKWMPQERGHPAS